MELLQPNIVSIGLAGIVVGLVFNYLCGFGLSSVLHSFASLYICLDLMPCKFVHLHYRLRTHLSSCNISFYSYIAAEVSTALFSIWCCCCCCQDVSRKLMNSYEELKELMGNHCKDYLKKLHSIDPPPCVPFLGWRRSAALIVQDSNFHGRLSSVCDFVTLIWSRRAVRENDFIANAVGHLNGNLAVWLTLTVNTGQLAVTVFCVPEALSTEQ